MPRNQLSAFDKKLRKEISENLKKYTAGITQNELSALTGIPTSTLSGYFAMRSTPNAGNVQKIADALNISKDKIDPRFNSNTLSNQVADLPEITQRDEAQIAKDLEKMLADIDSNSSFAAHGGTVDNDEDRELLKAALLTSMRIAKRMAKDKYTPKKFKNNE